MKSKPFLLTTLLFLLVFTSKAQFIDLIGASEKQILDKVGKDYPIVKRDSTDHGFIPVLNFENQEKELTASFYFYPKKDACYQIKSIAPGRFMEAYIRLANSRYKQMGNNLWHSGDVQIRIIRMGDQVLTIFTKVPSGKEI